MRCIKSRWRLLLPQDREVWNRVGMLTSWQSVSSMHFHEAVRSGSRAPEQTVEAVSEVESQLVPLGLSLMKLLSHMLHRPGVSLGIRRASLACPFI
jgi:hypothetical protein